MSIETRSRQFGKVFDHWQMREFLGEGSGGKTAVFRLVRVDSQKGTSALKIVNLIEERGSFDALSEYRRQEYRAVLEEITESAAKEVWVMNDMQGNSNIVDYLDHTFVDWADENGFGRDMLIRMELLDDLRREMRRGTIFSQNEILKIGCDLCNALVLCHSKNIIHRDIKPENIFVNRSGSYKLGDFGVARILDSTASAMASTNVGTAEYAAPEQFHGKHDKRVDIYSLGLVLYELSNGNRLPFAETSYVRQQDVLRRLHGEEFPAPANAEPSLAQVIAKATAFRPEDRYATAEEFLDALEHVSVDTGDLVPEPPAVPEIPVSKRESAAFVSRALEMPEAPKKKKKWWIPAAAAALAAVVGIGALINRPAKEPAADVGAPEETAEIAQPQALEETGTPVIDLSGETDASKLVVLWEEGALDGGINTYKLPKLTLDGAVSGEFSQWVHSSYIDWSNNISWYRENDDIMHLYNDTLHLYYVSGIYDGILSVTLMVNGEPVNGWPNHDSFSVDLRTGKQLTTDRFIELNGGSWEQLEKYIRQDLQQMFEYELEEYGSLKDLKEMQEVTISSENLRKTDIVLNAADHGRIEVNVKIPYYVDANTKKVRMYNSNYPGIWCCNVENAAEIFMGKTEVQIYSATYEEMRESILNWPKLRRLTIVEPEASIEELLQLRQDFPEVEIHWQITGFGKTITDDTTELDLSGIPMNGIAEAEAAADLCPNLEKLIMSDCGIDNETMAAFRERKRDSYKVVWTVHFSPSCQLRTDDIAFMPLKQGEYHFEESMVHDLMYCEDLETVDLGHQKIQTIDFVRYMPHLKYLTLTASEVRDITPISECKELVYLDLTQGSVEDFTPLLGCTALEDLNIDDMVSRPKLDPIKQMTWLKNLWLQGWNVDIASLREAMPDTNISNHSHDEHGVKWRELPNYKAQRDNLNMPYMD